MDSSAQPSEVQVSNQVVLQGLVASRDALRSTPGGLATLNLVLRHRSVQSEGGHEVAVELELDAVAFGEVALAMNRLQVKDVVTVKGFLSRKSRWNDRSVLHINLFKIQSQNS